MSAEQKVYSKYLQGVREDYARKKAVESYKSEKVLYTQEDVRNFKLSSELQVELQVESLKLYEKSKESPNLFGKGAWYSAKAEDGSHKFRIVKGVENSDGSHDLDIFAPGERSFQREYTFHFSREKKAVKLKGVYQHNQDDYSATYYHLDPQMSQPFRKGGYISRQVTLINNPQFTRQLLSYLA